MTGVLCGCDQSGSENFVDRFGEPAIIDGIAERSIFMTQPLDKNLVNILACAFDTAWQSYYGQHRGDTLPQETARSSLASFLVARAKEGLHDEAALSEQALDYLIGLTPAKPSESSGPAPTVMWSLSCSGSLARFGTVWRWRIIKLGSR